MSNNQPTQENNLQKAHTNAAAGRTAYRPQEQHDGRGPKWREDQRIKEQQQTEQQQQQGGGVSRQADDAPRRESRTAQFGTYAAGRGMKQQGDETWTPGSREKKRDSIERARTTEDRGYSPQMG